jgi:hypothetical protein
MSNYQNRCLPRRHDGNSLSSYPSFPRRRESLASNKLSVTVSKVPNRITTDERIDYFFSF